MLFWFLLPGMTSGHRFWPTYWNVTIARPLVHLHLLCHFFFFFQQCSESTLLLCIAQATPLLAWPTSSRAESLTRVDDQSLYRNLPLPLPPCDHGDFPGGPFPPSFYCHRLNDFLASPTSAILVWLWKSVEEEAPPQSHRKHTERWDPCRTEGQRTRERKRDTACSVIHLTQHLVCIPCFSCFTIFLAFHTNLSPFH